MGSYLGYRSDLQVTELEVELKLGNKQFKFFLGAVPYGQRCLLFFCFCIVTVTAQWRHPNKFSLLKRFLMHFVSSKTAATFAGLCPWLRLGSMSISLASPRMCGRLPRK